MSVGLSLALGAVPFFDLLEREVAALSEAVHAAEGTAAASSAMAASRRRLAQGAERFVRALPAVVRNDASLARHATYALVGLADERMLHHPAGGLERWRELLLESELYGTALAGQEVVRQARMAAQGVAAAMEPDAGPGVVLAPLYLAVLREGFEGALRGDALGLSNLVTSLEEAVGGAGSVQGEGVVVGHMVPSRLGVTPLALAALGVGGWLATGLALWLVLPHEALVEAERVTHAIEAGRAVHPGPFDPHLHTLGPSALPPSLLEVGADAAASRPR